MSQIMTCSLFWFFR